MNFPCIQNSKLIYLPIPNLIKVLPFFFSFHSFIKSVYPLNQFNILPHFNHRYRLLKKSIFSFTIFNPFPTVPSLPLHPFPINILLLFLFRFLRLYSTHLPALFHLHSSFPLHPPSLLFPRTHGQRSMSLEMDSAMHKQPSPQGRPPSPPPHT